MAVERQTFDYLTELLVHFMPISFSLQEKLKLIIFEEHHLGGTYILNNREIPIKSWIIIKGSAREFKTTKDYVGEQTQWFWFENEFIYTTPGFFSQQPAESYIEILEDSHLVCIDFQSFYSLKKTDPEAERLSELLRDQNQRMINKYLNQLRTLNGKARYELLFKVHPKLFNLAKQKDIAYFLGIVPDTLGKLRKNEK